MRCWGNGYRGRRPARQISVCDADLENWISKRRMMTKRKIDSQQAHSYFKMVPLAVLAAAGLCERQAKASVIAEAWGYNAAGELGDGTTTNRTAPVVIGGLSSGVTAVAAGYIHSLAIQNGSVWAWGSNGYGQLGDGTMANRTAPVAIIGLSSGVTAIAGGDSHSMAIKDGGVWSWGWNAYGMLGDDTRIDHTAPVAVTGLSSGVTAIAAGAIHSLAIQNGGAWAWGYNSTGALGDGTVNVRTAPVAVIGLSSGVTAIAAGAIHSLAVQNGGVWAWGYNFDGELGDGTTTQRNAPVALSNLSSGVTAVAGGYSHSLAVQNGSVWAWGDNRYGQLGDGTITNRTAPEEIDSADLTSIIAVAAGALSSYALSGDGSLWVWGYNGRGDLGLDSNTSYYMTPQHLLPPSGYLFSSVDSDAKGDHALATLAVATPEPATLSLLAISGLALLARCRRNCRSYIEARNFVSGLLTPHTPPTAPAAHKYFPP